MENSVGTEFFVWRTRRPWTEIKTVTDPEVDTEISREVLGQWRFTLWVNTGILAAILPVISVVRGEPGSDHILVGQKLLHRGR